MDALQRPPSRKGVRDNRHAIAARRTLALTTTTSNAGTVTILVDVSIMAPFKGDSCSTTDKPEAAP